jgi:hypothetical protein
MNKKYWRLPRVWAQLQAYQSKPGVPARKSQSCTSMNTTVADHKYSRAEVNTILNKLKKKMEEETREREEICHMMEDINAEEPLTIADLEEFLKNDE